MMQVESTLAGKAFVVFLALLVFLEIVRIALGVSARTNDNDRKVATKIRTVEFVVSYLAAAFFVIWIVLSPAVYAEITQLL